MALRRTILALLLSLTMAFMPAVSMAMGYSCAVPAQATSQMTGDQVANAQAVAAQASPIMDEQAPMSMPANCPCNQPMANCNSMPQCQTASGCACQCLGSLGVITAAEYQACTALNSFAIGPSQAVASLAIAPPAPPPRA